MFVFYVFMGALVSTTAYMMMMIWNSNRSISSEVLNFTSTSLVCKYEFHIWEFSHFITLQRSPIYFWFRIHKLTNMRSFLRNKTPNFLWKNLSLRELFRTEYLKYSKEHAALEAEKLQHNATWHGIGSHCKAANPGAAFIFLATDWLTSLEWRWRRLYRISSAVVLKQFPLSTLVHIKVY